MSVGVRKPPNPVIMNESRPSGSRDAFAAFGLGKNVLRALSEAGFQKPRPIQSEAIPQTLKGRDILGLAQTGTGKTAAFALPIIERLAASGGNNPRALILAPTRELVVQIHREIELLAKYTKIRAMTIYGGVSAKPQVNSLRRLPDIVVACPGRLLDLAGSRDAHLDGVEVLVLDEADHMLDMGFLPDIKRILKLLPADRQNLLFSATMPREMRSLTDRILRDPHVVELAHSMPVETVEHALYPVDHQQKGVLLRHLLGGEDFKSAIVFLRTKHRARRLAQDLGRAGHRAIALQGNMSQAQRQIAMQGFRDGRFDVLVATDIAARGIDVANVSHVINFDIPNTPDAYTHRIGRTGRSEKSGKACTFVTRDDFRGIKAIERRLNLDIPRIQLKELLSESGEKKAQPVNFSRPPREGKKSNPRPPKARKPGGGPSGKNRGFRKRRGKPAAARPFSFRKRNGNKKARRP